MRAEITYNGGKSYLLMGVKFVEGQTRVVTNPAVIERCQHTAGFAVQVLKDKVVREVVTPDRPAPAEVDEVEEPPRRKTRTGKSE